MKTLEQRVAALEQSVVRYGSLTAPAGGAVGAARLRVGSGAMIQQVTRYTFNYSPGAIAGAQSIATVAFTLPGLSVGDVVIVNPPNVSNAQLCTAWVAGANQMNIAFVNPTAVAQTPPAGTYTVIAIRANN